MKEVGPGHLVCPECGNEDMNAMRLVIIDRDWSGYMFVEVDEETGTPLFTYSKSLYSETTDEPPKIECRYYDREVRRGCTHEWEVEWEDFELT